MGPIRSASLSLLAALTLCAAPGSAAPAHRTASRRLVTRQALSKRSATSQPPARVDQILDNTADILWQISDNYYHNGDYEQLIRIGHLVEVMQPHFEEPYGNLSWLEWSGGNNQAAIDDLSRGILSNPNDYLLWDEMGDCYQAWLKQPALALPYYIKATSFYSEAPWAAFGALAHAAEDAGDYTRAAIAWRTAAMKTDGDPAKTGPTAHNLERVLKKLARSGS